MSKKSKRQSRRTPAATSGAVVAAPRPTGRASSISSEKMTEKEFKPDYRLTIKDLRRIGLLAGSFFVILVVLSFFLR
jgi:hypothetical protein